MEIIVTPNLKVSPETNRKRRGEYKRIRPAFIATCGESVLNRGNLDKKLSIHHQVPTSLKEGNNSFDNLCVISKRLHELINVEIYDKQINSKAKMCVLPKFARVVDDEEKKQLFEYLERSK